MDAHEHIDLQNGVKILPKTCFFLPDFIGGDHGINSIKYPFLGYDGSIPSSPGPGYHFSHSVKLKNVRM